MKSIPPDLADHLHQSAQDYRATTPEPPPTRCYQIELPLPPRELSPNWNKRSHWAKTRATKEYREVCGYIFLYSCIHLRPEDFPAILHLDFYLSRENAFLTTVKYFPRDEQNAIISTKAAIDSMTDAGLLPGDSAKYVRMGRTTLHTRKEQHQGRCCVVLTIETTEKEMENKQK